jgi:hypothetical protein
MPHANDTTHIPAHEHDFTADAMVIGLERCWCGATREVPDVEDCAVELVPVVVERARRAA